MSSNEILIVEDDEKMLRAVSRLLRSVGHETIELRSAAEYLELANNRFVTCALLDVRLPGMSGLELYCKISHEEAVVPTVFLTGYGDIPMAVTAMKLGAYEFLTKPFREQDLLDAVAGAIDWGYRMRESLSARDALFKRYETLTSREREVMCQVVTGRLNKLIAVDLGLSEVTIKVYRAQIMRKMEAGSIAELARMAERMKETTSVLTPLKRQRLNSVY